MKKYVIIALLILFFSTAITYAVEEQICGIGAILLKDPYGKKTFILKVLPNSPAQKMNLPVGAEIISVDDVKTKKYSIDEISNIIKGEEGSKVNLLVKYKGQKTNYEITRGKVTIPQKKVDKTFDLHWKQVVPEGYENAEILPMEIYDRICRDYRLLHANPNNYWAERKLNFKKGYDACMSYPKTEQNACLMNLVNREIAKTDNDKQLTLQEQMMRQQAIYNITSTMNQIQTNTNLNNINNSLQQQNFNLMNTNMQLHNINNTLRGW